MTDAPLVLREDRADGLTTLTLNRPSQFNSLSKEMLSALQSELDAIAASTTVRVVVIAGAGKAFCAGHDLKEMRANHSKEFMKAFASEGYAFAAEASDERTWVFRRRQD